MDLRIGNGTLDPGNGLSVNLVRTNDDVLDDGAGFALGPDGLDAPEEGCKTGLSVCFDTQDNGSGDIVGISVRLDNGILTNVAFPVPNGVCGDTASLQTGPYDAANPGSPDSLCWARLVIRLETNQNLTITYKSAVVISNLPTAFSPSPLRLVLAAHTATATECIMWTIFHL